MSFKEKFKSWWTGEYKDSLPSVGGQAVMEGVMMKGPKGTAITVRKTDGTMTYVLKPGKKVGEKHKWLRIPFIRGIANFVVMLYEGMKTLTDSADMAGLDTEEPTKFEKKVALWLHCKPDDVMMGSAVVLAVILAVGLFSLLPNFLGSLIKRAGLGEFMTSLLSGLIRITLFLAYVFLCSRLKEIRRVFMYHGAEHKSIHCFEHGDELTVENARKYTTLHPRCGTSFLVIVMVISILCSTLFGLIMPESVNKSLLWRMLSRIWLFLPVSGISYEVLKSLGRAKDTKLVKALRWPGLMAQKLTTAEPDDSMLEVALVSLKASLGWEKPLPDSYYEETEEEAADEEEAGE